MENTELLQIEPPQLRFHFELENQSFCSLLLANKTTHYVAFKVKSTAPKKYSVKPTKGIIAPHGTCDVTVTMQARCTARLDFQCKDKFLIQSTVASPDDILSKNSGSTRVEETKLRVLLRDFKQDDQIQAPMIWTRITEQITILFMKQPNDAAQLSLAKNIEDLKKDVEDLKSKLSVMADGLKSLFHR